MVLTHAGTLTIQSYCIPASWSADLSLSVKLHNVAAAIASKAQLDRALKPGTRNLPSFVFGVPYGLPSLIVTYPLFIVSGKGKLHQKWRWPLTPENDRHRTLPP